MPPRHRAPLSTIGDVSTTSRAERLNSLREPVEPITPTYAVWLVAAVRMRTIAHFPSGPNALTVDHLQAERMRHGDDARQLAPSWVISAG
jgi:hypothetical protein